jgi:hypothetical protein
MRGGGLDLSAVQGFKNNDFSLKNIDNLLLYINNKFCNRLFDEWR